MKILIFLVALGFLLLAYRVLTQRQRSTTQSHRPDVPVADLMSVVQALELLGLETDAGSDDVIDAHRRLMQKVHPDKGGSVPLARQLNEAKHVLLKSFKSN